MNYFSSPVEVFFFIRDLSSQSVEELIFLRTQCKSPTCDKNKFFSILRKTFVKDFKLISYLYIAYVSVRESNIRTRFINIWNLKKIETSIQSLYNLKCRKGNWINLFFSVKKETKELRASEEEINIHNEWQDNKNHSKPKQY